MNTCENCQWWKKGLRYPRDGVDAEHLVQTGICDNEEAFPIFYHGGEINRIIHVSTWFDFPACPRFKAKQHWSDKAADRVCQIIQNEGLNTRTQERAGELIREEAAKAGVK
jgi:hypothetical protein